MDEEIEKAFDSLRDQLEQRRKELLEKSEQLEAGKMSVVNMKLENFHRVKEDLSFASQFVHSALATHSPGELLSIKKMMKEKLTSVILKFNEVSLVIDDNDDMITSLDLTAISGQVAKFGSVVDVNLFKSYLAEGIAVPLAVVGKVRKFKVVLVDENGERLNAKALICAAIKFKGGELPNTKNDLIVSPGVCGVVELTISPQSVGEHELSAMIGGQHVQNSPYTVWVRNPPSYRSASCQKYFNADNYTYGVAVHPSGDVYVTSESHCICVFDSNATEKSTIGSQGSGDGQLVSPRGIALVGEV